MRDIRDRVTIYNRRSKKKHMVLFDSQGELFMTRGDRRGGQNRRIDEQG